MKVFHGRCDAAQLMRFSKEVIGLSERGDELVIPDSKNRRSSHVAYCGDKPGHPYATRYPHGPGSNLKLGLYELASISKIYWRSKRRNELTAEALVGGLFQLVLVERVQDCCTYREILHRNRVELRLQS